MKCNNFLCDVPVCKKGARPIQSYIRNCKQRKAFNRLEMAYRACLGYEKKTPLYNQWEKEKAKAKGGDS